MSVIVTKEVWARSQAKGNSLVVLLALADHVNDYEAREGLPWVAWPSRSTLAEKCNCDLATVQRRLNELLKRGEIQRVRNRRRGVVEYEITLASSEDDQSQVASGDAKVTPDVTPCHTTEQVTQVVDDLAQVEGDQSQVASLGDAPLRHKPEGTKNLESEGEHMSSFPPDQDDVLSGSPEKAIETSSASHPAEDKRQVEEQLAALREQLPRARGALAIQTEQVIATLEGQLEGQAA